MFTFVVVLHPDFRFLILSQLYNHKSIFFSVGLNAIPMDPDKTEIYPVLSGNGTLQHSWNLNENYTVCTSVFRNENEKVVCLNWGFLP